MPTTDSVSFMFTCRNNYIMQLHFNSLTIQIDEVCDLNIQYISNILGNRLWLKAQRYFLDAKWKTDIFNCYFFVKIDQVWYGLCYIQHEMKLILNFSFQFSRILLWYKTRTNNFPKLWLFTTIVLKPTCYISWVLF